jgi:thymidylate synthase
MYSFEGPSANEVWLQAASAFQAGIAEKQPGRGGETDELLHVTFTILNPIQRWVTVRQPAINPAFAIVEVVWILTGNNEAAFLNYWNTQLPKFAGGASQYHGAYGYRLRRQFQFDQIERAYFALRNNPQSRQVILQIWDPNIDFPLDDGKPTDPDIPCNVLSMLKIRDGKLEWMQIMRSNDLFKGTPYNFVQFTSLQEIISGWLDVEPGTYNHLSDSLHVYHYDHSQMNLTVNAPQIKNTDSLLLAKEESEAVFIMLENYFRSLTQSGITQKQLARLVHTKKLPPAYHNWLLVVAAEAARRRGWHDVSQDVMEHIENPLLIHLTRTWFDRFAQQ